MKFSSPLIPGTLLRRYRRFLVDVRLEDGSTVTAHCPNSGSMVGCSEPGRPVLLLKSTTPNRKNALNWELIHMNGTWVSINPLLGQKIAIEAIEAGTISSLKQYGDPQRDAIYGMHTEVDILMHGMERNAVVNIFTVTWAEDDVALFPDAVNPKAEKKILQLAEIAQQGHHATALFFVQRGDCTALRPAEQIQRGFLKAMLTAQNAGVEFLVYRAVVTPDAIDLGTQIPCSLT
jgi:sugar fermentation stimulation protein A